MAEDAIWNVIGDCGNSHGAATGGEPPTKGATVEEMFLAMEE